MPQITNEPIRFVPVPASPAATILGAHAHLIERLAGNKPCHLNPAWHADADDFNERAEHLQRAFIAFSDYVRVAVKDIADTSTELDENYIFGCLNDLGSEIVGALEIAADKREVAA